MRSVWLVPLWLINPEDNVSIINTYMYKFIFLDNKLKYMYVSESLSAMYISNEIARLGTTVRVQALFRTRMTFLVSSLMTSWTMVDSSGIV